MREFGTDLLTFPVRHQALLTIRQQSPNFMQKIMQQLFELQALEFEKTIPPDQAAHVASLRAAIPQPMLAHYDRMLVRGKKGVALVHHQTCSGCHMQVPLGVVLNLKSSDDVRLCETCQRYLYLPADPLEFSQPAPVATIAAVTPVKKARRRQLAKA